METKGGNSKNVKGNRNAMMEIIRNLKEMNNEGWKFSKSSSKVKGEEAKQWKLEENHREIEMSSFLGLQF